MYPGETDQPFHAADGSLPLPRPHDPLTCTAILALTDFDLENGATRVARRAARARRRDAVSAAAARWLRALPGLLGHVDQRDPETLVDPEVDSETVWNRMR